MTHNDWPLAFIEKCVEALELHTYITQQHLICGVRGHYQSFLLHVALCISTLRKTDPRLKHFPFRSVQQLKNRKF